MTVAINYLAAAHTKGNKETMNALVHLLKYAATYPDAKRLDYSVGLTTI